MKTSLRESLQNLFQFSHLSNLFGWALLLLRALSTLPILVFDLHFELAKLPHLQGKQGRRFELARVPCLLLSGGLL